MLAGTRRRLTSETNPPIAGRTWQVDIGGDNVTFTITQSNDGTEAAGNIADDLGNGQIARSRDPCDWKQSVPG